MSSKLEKIRSILDGSIELIDSQLENESALTSQSTISATGILPESSVTTVSVLEQCNAVCDEYVKPGKPLCRVIHHLACSGGTLISKCISAMPNVYLLSELHPSTPIHPPRENNPYFLPTDIPSLVKYANIPGQETLAEKIFSGSIKLTHHHVTSLGGTLVLRDHSTSDFCTGIEASPVPATVSALEKDFEILSLVSLRNPIDCFLSLRNNGWLEFQPPSFDEFCKRTICFLNAYSSSPVILYEDFIAKPKKTMREICELLRINYDHIFEEIFPIFRVSGDSGRSGNRIEPRDRFAFEDELQMEIDSSAAFREIAERYYPDEVQHIR